MQLEGLGQLKNQATSSGIDPRDLRINMKEIERTNLSETFLKLW
jgi:hypothetical protein